MPMDAGGVPGQSMKLPCYNSLHGKTKTTAYPASREAMSALRENKASERLHARQSNLRHTQSELPRLCYCFAARLASEDEKERAMERLLPQAKSLAELRADARRLRKD